MTPKEQSAKLMNAVVPFAKKMLADQGEFRPFGGYMLADGRIVDVGVDLDDNMSSSEAVDVLTNRFCQMASCQEAIAFAILYNVNILCPNGDKSDAIQVNIDHSLGYSVEVLYPYSIQDGNVVYGKMFAQKGDGKIFGMGVGE